MYTKTTTVLLLCFVLVLSTIGTSFAAESSIEKTMNNNQFNFSMEEYESVLPFKLTTIERIEATKHFDSVSESFEKNDLIQAEKSLHAFYKIMSKHWISEKALTVLLPFDDMMNYSGKILNDAQKKALKYDYFKLTFLRKTNKFEEYFKTIKKIHSDYYAAIGKSIGDINGDLQLIQYIKGANQLTPTDLVNYSYDDYLKILPFNMDDSDYLKGKVIFENIIAQLEIDNTTRAKELTEDLNNILATYWISNESLNLVVPHEKYKKEYIQYFSRKEQLELNSAYKAIKTAQNTKDFDAYFMFINKYFQTLGLSIQNFYTDYFDEIVFIRS